MHACKLAVSFFILASLPFTPAFPEGNATSESLVAGVEALEGPLEYVVCSSNGPLNVRNEQLTNVLFTVIKGDRALPVQSFGTDSIKKIMGGKTYYFIKLQFPDRKSKLNTGWVAKSFLSLKSQCAGLANPAVPPVATSPAWVFPTAKRAVQSYVSGMRKFKASRSGGRLHAAADLYRVINDSVLAVTAGTVIRDRYYFYQGTYAMEVAHSGGIVVRYGEITGKSAADAGLNKVVKTNQVIGYIGKVNSGCCTPMLHFEMYSGKANGSLTQSGNAFSRRKDLIDPTRSLQTWEKQVFGVSY